MRFRKLLVIVSIVFIVDLLFPFGLPAPQEKPPGSATPAVITAGPDWIPLRQELEIAPGSALDFSGMGFQDAPAGKHGRVIARPDGQFAFEKKPDAAQRFYGVNLCYSAHYINHEESDRLAERFVRLGYNTVRFHHYEGNLAQGMGSTTDFNPERLDQLDYLFYALARRGIYISTDLFVSRPVAYREIGVDRDGPVGMDHFKVLVPVHDGAWQNWKLFSRRLLEHVNPYTKRRYADDPALAWLSLINEGNFGNFIADIRTIPEWRKAWNEWLARRYSGRETLAGKWGEELKHAEDPRAGTVAFPENVVGNSPRVRDCLLFFMDTEVDLTRRMRAFLREEVKCGALITSTNSWTNHPTGQRARGLYDYVDDHFYVDHPEFLQRSWQLPSRNPNTSPVARGAAGGRDRAFTRLFDKPFTITEYNYSGPGRFRGVGGILTGALASVQGWAGLWRFAYSHNRDNLFSPSRIDYFDMSRDPLAQASERASLCLFLRGDMKAAPHRVGLAIARKDLDSTPDRIPRLAPRWHWAAWLTRIGTQLVEEPSGAPAFSLLFPLGWGAPASAYGASAGAVAENPYSIDEARIAGLLREKGIVRDASLADPANYMFRSETGEITINGQADVLTLDTPRTAGGYAPAGKTIQTADGSVRIEVAGSDATVWVSALDSRPIRQSRRLLVTHLTDLQNTEIKYAETARQTLLEWGKLPHLVRAGKATVRIKLDSPENYGVWALAVSGTRLGEMKTAVQSGILQFEADVAGGAESGARMLYEIAAK